VNQAKYIGMDVHQATISVAVMDSAGKLILESILADSSGTHVGADINSPGRRAGDGSRCRSRRRRHGA